MNTKPLALALSAALAACGGDGAAKTAPGNVIEVRMVTDEVGNYFEPSEITARPGDVLRFALVTGVHNVSFPSARNAGARALPPPTGYLTEEGQTVDVPVTMPPGSYYFQCDPHVALGMTGTLTVK